MFATTTINTVTRIAFLLRRKISLVELEGGRYQIVGGFSTSSVPTVMAFAGEYLCTGYDQTFTLLDWPTGTPMTLVSTNEPSLRFLRKSDATLGNTELLPIACFAIPATGDEGLMEFLLCYNLVGVFVNKAGLQSRQLELHWTRSMEAFALRYPYVVGFNGSYAEVVDVTTGGISQVVQVATQAVLSQSDMLLLACNQGRTSLAIMQDLRDRPEMILHPGADEGTASRADEDVDRKRGRRFTLAGSKKPSVSKERTGR